MDVGAAAVAFSTIFLVELPDKTFIATLLLTTRFRPLLVWIGVALAFLAQTAIAVGLGSVAGLLPETVVQLVAFALFLAGGVLLLREARVDRRGGSGEAETTLLPGGADDEAHGLRAVLASAAVLFAAEWGDVSQLLTLSLVTRYDDALAVFAGAWAALLTVSGLAVLVGRALFTRVPLWALHTAGGALCLLLAGVTALDLAA